MREKTSLRARLREVTEPAHERMHHHAGFAGAAAGNIALDDYRSLLARLLGFHRAFEAAGDSAVRAGNFDLALAERARAPMLVEDLIDLGMDRDDVDALPLARNVGVPTSEAGWLGALYVIEGSTLGGVQIARALKALFDEEGPRGRRFFLGYGERHGAMWRSFLDRLEQLGERPGAADEAIEAAHETFAAFEAWMADWRGADVRFNEARRADASLAAAI